MRLDREDELDLADIGGESDAATHDSRIASSRSTPKWLDKDESGCANFTGTKKEDSTPGNPREMITMAERRFRVRIRIGIPRKRSGSGSPK